MQPWTMEEQWRLRGWPRVSQADARLGLWRVVGSQRDSWDRQDDQYKDG